MGADGETLEALVRAETSRPVPPEIAALAQAARARHERGGGVLAVLAYGSTLREANPRESLVDLYVLTADFAAVSASAAARLGCRLVPPNVHYLETTSGGETWRAKYACLPLAQFARRMGGDVSNPYFWARFSQPCRIVWAADEAARAAVVAALVRAVETMIAAGRSLSGEGDGWRGIWRAALAATYATELRVETAARADLIVERNAAWCEKTVAAAPAPAAPLRARWRLRRAAGKLWSAARLLKAAFTFEGGADYLAWKIERHSGVRVPLTDFQRRHPVLAAVRLLPMLLRKGAVR